MVHLWDVFKFNTSAKSRDMHLKKEIKLDKVKISNVITYDISFETRFLLLLFNLLLFSAR